VTPFITLDGLAGAGKTKISQLLTKKYRTHWYPRITTRNRRPGEIPGQEYLFISEDQFKALNAAHRIMPHTVRHSPKKEGGNEYRGILVPEMWPQRPGTEQLRLSVFGSRIKVVKAYLDDHRGEFPEFQNMHSFFIGMRDTETLRRRLQERCRKHKLNFIEKWKRNLWYTSIDLQGDYEHIVYNDGTPEECIAEIERIAGLIQGS
jgi:guanylate kinase